MRHIVFILHGKISTIQTLKQSILTIFNKHYYTHIVITQKRYHTIELAKEYAEKSFEYLIVAGGDGSFNELVNGYLQSSVKKSILGLLPYGTGNDFARTIKVNNNLKDLYYKLMEDSYQTIDLKLVQCVSREGNVINRYGVNITDIGLGGTVVKMIEKSQRKFGSFITYQWAIFRGFFIYKKTQIKVKADTFEYEEPVLAFIVANGNYFGGGLGIAPEASIDDGLLDVIALGQVSYWDYFIRLRLVKKSIKLEHPSIKYYKAKELAITCPSSRLPIDMDGEFIGYTPLKITVVPKKIHIIA